MEACEERANFCSSVGLGSAILSTAMANAEKIKQSAQKTTKLRVPNVSYTRNFNVENTEQLLSLFKQKKKIPLT